MMSKQTRAPYFAAELRKFIRQEGNRQRKLAMKLGVSTSTLNRLLKHGIGSDDQVAVVLNKLNLKHRVILNMLIKRRAELSEGVAREIWNNYGSRYEDEEEMLRDIAPCPLNLANAAARLGSSAQEICKNTSAAGIHNVEDREALSFEYNSMIDKFIRSNHPRLGGFIQQSNDGKSDPLFFLDFKDGDASEYTDTSKCNGTLFLGFPHVLLGMYNFETGGTLRIPGKIGGMECLLSIRGEFRIAYKGIHYSGVLSSKNICVLDGRHDHTISFGGAGDGLLQIWKIYPSKRDITLSSGIPQIPLTVQDELDEIDG